MADEGAADEWGYFEMTLAAVCTTLGAYFLGNAVLDYISNGPSPSIFKENVTFSKFMKF